MDSRVKEKLKDPILGRQVAFLMYYVCSVDELDEIQALYILDVLGKISRREEVSSFALPQKCNHIDIKFSDGINRTYDEVNGFVEI